MEHFIRTAFWIVTLSGCLEGKALPRIDISDTNIKLMQEDVQCPPDSTFYTPTNVEDKHTTAAIECFLKELNGTVREECEDPNKYINNAVNFWEYYMKTMNRQSSNTTRSNYECEKWPLQPFTEFLKNMESLTEQINSVDCFKQ